MQQASPRATSRHLGSSLQSKVSSAFRFKILRIPSSTYSSSPSKNTDLEFNHLIENPTSDCWIFSAETVLFALTRVADTIIHRKIFFAPGQGFSLNTHKGYTPSLHELLQANVQQGIILPKSLFHSRKTTSTATYGGRIESQPTTVAAAATPPTSNQTPIATTTTAKSSDPSSRGRWEIPPEEIEKANLVGKGAFGEVYRGWWRGATVAIKLMTGTTKPEEIQQFKNEAALLTLVDFSLDYFKLVSSFVATVVLVVQELFVFYLTFAFVRLLRSSSCWFVFLLAKKCKLFR